MRRLPDLNIDASPLKLPSEDVFTNILEGQTVTIADLLQDVEEQRIDNAGLISGGIFGVTTGLTRLVNFSSGKIGEDDAPAQVTATGSGSMDLMNFGAITASIQLGLGADYISNFGAIVGSISSSGGSDVVFNQGLINGDVRTGSGNDNVVNEGQIDGNVQLGDGNDLYTTSSDGDVNDQDHTARLVLGGAGNDRLLGGAHDDAFDGGAQSDDLRGYGGNDVLKGGDGNDDVFGGEDHDTLIGGKGSDFLDGGDGNDALFGESGRDTLNGGRGDDVLSGGSGADVFVFGAQSGADTITDFRDQDIVQLPELMWVTASYYSGISKEKPLSFDGVQACLIDVDGGVKLDLDALFNGVGFPSLTGGGGENSIFFQDLSATDLSEDQFIL